MGAIRNFLARQPSLLDLPIRDYRLEFSLSRLVRGVDNIHFDVHLSSQLRRTTERAAFCLMIRHSGVQALLQTEEAGKWKPIREAFRDQCRHVMTAAVHKAKSKQEIQIDYLGRVAIAKLIKTAVETQYEKTIERLEKELRSYELSHRQDLAACVAIKEKLSWIRLHFADLIRDAAAVLLDLAAGEAKEIDALREANFGSDALLPTDFFCNPLLYAQSPDDDGLLLHTYVLLGHRFEDPDSYERLMTLVDEFLQKTDLPAILEISKGDDDPEPAASLSRIWLVPENVDILFDDSQTAVALSRLPAGKPGREERRRLSRRRRTQRRMIRSIYRSFRRAGLVNRVAAGFEVQSLVDEFCPPLSSQQVLRFLIEPPARKKITAQLNRLRGFYDRPLSVSSLNKAIRHIRSLPGAKLRERLLLFLRALSRYHRELTHYRLIKAAMDAASIDLDERTMHLSRENRTLYDFLLPDEQVKEEQPIISHVVIKADVRGSTDLTYRMRSEQLNPASFFSLNLFDPITEVQFDYDATKEFIEGDALILSISEQKDTPEGWYCVGRACGLAVRILQIVAQSNIKSRKHRLPTLEMGIGICYSETTPAFLFDGANRIMISPAINRADRLSGCNKSLRKLIEKRDLPFHLYVFQSVSEKEKAQTADDLLLRYNVNGIELNAGGFHKLSAEITLVALPFSAGVEAPDAGHRFYAGRLPLISGRYQTVVIREAPVFRVSPDTLQVIGKTTEHYYEVCTHPRLYEKAEQVLGAKKADWLTG